MITDFKNSLGLWQQSKFVDNRQYLTRTGSLWQSLKARCREGGHEQFRFPTYIGVKNNFKDFQHFAEWCHMQIGFLNVKWQLDKDILSKNIKEYSPDTCCFVPSEINGFFLKCDSARGTWKVGVTFNANKYNARCRNAEGRKVHIGSFFDEQSAFLAYKRYKEQVAKVLAEKWKEQIDVRVYESLLSYQVKEED